MSRRNSLWLLCLIILSGIVLRLYHIGLRSIWFDEAFTWRLIQFPWGEMLQRATLDVHPPLFYILIKPWALLFGASIVSLRLFSVTMAALTSLTAYLFTTTVCRDRRAGLLAAALVAFSGWQIAFSWEARMYTLGTALALFSSYLLVKATTRKKQNLWLWGAYGLAAVALAYVHYYAFFTLAAQGIFVIGLIIVQTRGRIGEMLQSRLLGGAVLAVVVVGALYAAWIPILLRQNAQVQTSFWIPALNRWSVPDTFYRMLLPTAASINHDGWQSLIALFPLMLFIVISLWLVLRKPLKNGSTRSGTWLTVLGIFTPFVVSILLSLRGQSLYQDRYFIFAHVFMLCALAMALHTISFTIVRRSLIIITLASFLLSYRTYWQELAIAQHSGLHAAVTRVYTKYNRKDPVVVGSSFIYFSVAHYAKEEFAAGNPLLYSSNGQIAHFAGGPILTKLDITGPDIFTKTANKGIWLIDTTGFGGQPLPIPPGWKVTSEATYSEVFGYQGDIIVRRLER